MLVAQQVIGRGAWADGSAFDHVALDFDARHRRRFAYDSAGGTHFLLSLPRATVLRDGDALLLSDGRLIAVHAAPEPLMEVHAGADANLARLAWHIGNRHLPAEVLADRIRLRADHVIQAMLVGLGAEVVLIDGPFTPEPGAYAGSGGGRGHHGHHAPHDHDHAHDHDHDHDHDHHHHAH